VLETEEDSTLQEYLSESCYDELCVGISRIVQDHARWVKCKFGALENMSGLVEARSQMTTADQCHYGTQSLFSAIPPVTRPHFIRCINPKRAGVSVASRMAKRFDINRVREQLINNGIVDTVQVRQQGFAYRRDKRAFLGSYAPLLPDEFRDMIEAEMNCVTDDIVDSAINALFKLLEDSIPRSEYIIGTTMLFIKSTDTLTILNKELALAGDSGTALHNALNAADKTGVEYCQDLFLAIVDAIKNQVRPRPAPPFISVIRPPPKCLRIAPHE
jgi:hypothetical protein